MITEDDIAAWRQAQFAALSTIDGLDSEATKPYQAATTSSGGADLLALSALDVRAQAAGFSPLYQHKGKFFSKYGPILIRVFVEHKNPTVWLFTFAAKGRGLRNVTVTIVEVAEYQVTRQDQTGIMPREYVVKQLYFDAAGLVLPQH